MEEMEEQKPFACKWNGCGKSFTNEDHWSVHSKKHEMSLNLGLANRSSSFIGMSLIQILIEISNLLLSFFLRSNTNSNTFI